MDAWMYPYESLLNVTVVVCESIMNQSPVASEMTNYEGKDERTDWVIL